MKPTQSKWQLLASVVLMVGLLAALFPLGRSALATDVIVSQDLSTDIPELLAPLGIITEQYPSYSWTRVFATSSYQYQVWRGGTKVLDKTVGYSVCSADTCTVKPTTKLIFGTYKWRARAYVAGTWNAWSEYSGFVVSGPAFKAGFNFTMSGWQKKAGAIWKTSPTAIYTNGIGDYWSSVYRPVSQYVDFDYSVRMKRTGGTYEETWYPAQYVAVRMGNSVNAANTAWYPGYIFGYRDDGYFSIWEYDAAGAVSAIQPWTESASIVPYGWNVLRVVAYGNSYDYYINGTLVYSFSESIRTKGFVGVEMYAKAGATPTKVQVDWAKLSFAEPPTSKSLPVPETKPGASVDSGGSPEGGQ